MFPIAPDVLDRIEFRRIGRQVIELQATLLARDEFPDQPTAMKLGAIPDHQQLARQVAQQSTEKVHRLGGADGDLFESPGCPPRPSSRPSTSAKNPQLATISR